MTAQADSPAVTASRRRAVSAPAAKPPSSHGLAELTSALQGWLRCGCSSAVAAPMAMPIAAAVESARAQWSRIVTSLAEVAGRSRRVT
jgi:hypothetical protein